jgi:hypothetical protein
MVSRCLQTARGSKRKGPVLTENGESNSHGEEHVGAVAQHSRKQKGHLSKVLTSAEKLLRFGVGGNKLLSSLNQVIYPHSSLGSLLPCYPYWATKSISATKVLAISGPIGMLCYAETLPTYLSLPYSLS